MRFHHSTRRGRNRFSQGGNHSAHGGGKFGATSHSLSSRWAQLSYCRQTNIHFNRRQEVELPDEMRQLTSGGKQTDAMLVANLNDGFQDGLRAAQSANAHQFQTDVAPAEPAPEDEAGATFNLQQVDLKQLSLSPPGQQSRRQQTTSGSQQESERATQHLRKNSVRRPSESGQPSRARKQAPEQEEVENSQPRNSKQRGPAAKLDLEGAREKLIAQVDKHPFWSSKAARRMRLLDVHERQIYIYELVSYCEKRDLEWRYEAHRGGKLGSRPFGAASSLRRTPTVTSTGSQPASSSPRAVVQSQQQGQPELEATEPYQDAAADQQQHSSATARPALQATKSYNSAVQRPHHFAYELPTAGGESDCQQLAKQQSAAASRLRRSCSSATSSPVHHSPAGSGAGLSAAASEMSPAIKAAASPTGTPSEPRPLPSAELVWSIEPPEHLRPALFASYVHTSEVPGTSFVKRCHGCDGRGRLKCTTCYGVGYEVCISCTGKGSLRSYSSMSAGGGLGSSARSGLGARSGGGGVSASESRRDQAGGITGSMWSNVEESGSRLGSSRNDAESGGIASGSSEICANCSGAGQKRCWICAGRSFITCTACAGTGSLRCFLNLNITYINHRDEACLNNADGIIPRDRLKLSAGLLLAEETAERLQPLASGGDCATRGREHSTEPTDGATNYNRLHHHHHHHHHHHQHRHHQSSHLEQVARPGELIQLNALSAKLLDKHWSTYKHERFIKQRQRVTQIECFKVDWEFRKKRGHFVVYGDERKVYIAKYPFKSICNIT